VFAIPAAWAAEWSLDIEAGAAINGYNDVRIPGDLGTDLSLSQELEAASQGFARLRIARELGDRHRIWLLVAPLVLKASGSVGRPVDFNGTRFDAGEHLSSRFRFDSYRLSYQYTVYRSERLRAGLGLTAKIRDAAIRVAGVRTSSEKTNTGFVPLINFALDWQFAPKAGVLFEGDALAAPQGRAEDVLLAIYKDASESLRVRLGYRVLEGGADNDEVYTFTLVHYLGLGLTFRL
jgi:hypothetical protein